MSTMAAPGELAVDGLTRRKAPAWWRFARTLASRPLYAVSLLIVVLIVASALFAEQLAPYGYNDLVARRLQDPSGEHLLGTDGLGRDQLSRIIYASRTAMSVGLGSIAIGMVIALTIGVASGMAKGIVDLVVQRFVDAWMAFPAVVMLLTIVSALGTSQRNMVIALGLLLGVVSSRIIRAAVLSASAEQYVLAARSVGASEARITVRYIIPNILPVVVVLMSVNVGFSVLAEASLSFLGFGIQPPTPSWGNMLSADTQYMVISPWLAIVPGLTITITVFAFNMLGDGLRDWLDPRIRSF